MEDPVFQLSQLLRCLSLRRTLRIPGALGPSLDVDMDPIRFHSHQLFHHH